MPRRSYDESLKAQISIDENNCVRSIIHSVGEVHDAAEGPLASAIAYLSQHRCKFKIPHALLKDPSVSVSYRKPCECKEKFGLLEERHIFDSYMFFFSHTYLNIPVWRSGVKITIKDSPIRVVSAVNTTVLDVSASMPSEVAIRSFRRLFPGDNYDRRSGVDVAYVPSAGEQEELIKKIISSALGPEFTAGVDKTEPIIRGRFYVYRYNAPERLDHHVESNLASRSRKLRCVPRGIKEGDWYVVAELTFPYSTEDHGRVNLRMLVEPETYSVLYLGVLAAEVSGYAFRLDPISSSDDDTLTYDQDNCRLNRHRCRVTLNNLDPPLNGCQQLAGKYVKLQNLHPPKIAAPKQPSGYGFDYDVRTDQYAAVSAYFHTNQIFEEIKSLGFPIDTYFKNTSFPISVDHRGFGGEIGAHCVGDGRGGIGHVCYGIMHESEDGTLGRACDPRVHWHELCGHGVLYEAVDSANFRFAHSAGDGISGIFFDPESRVRSCCLRFDYAPWHPTIRRRFDRDIATGWAWGGSRDDRGYGSEQILATCHFRVYRAIGGDSPDLGRRNFASRTMIYLLLRAIYNLTPESNPEYAREFADELMAVDRLNWTSEEDMNGGVYNKVIRWSFEKQGEYQSPLVTRDDPRFRKVQTAGDPPEQDVYIDDGRSGEYEYQHIYWNTTTIWNRWRPDWGEAHQPPIEGTKNYAYVKLRNRGTKTAHGVRVRGYHCRPTAGVTWPTDLQAMTTPMIDVVGTVWGKNREERIVGAFEWMPTTNGRGHDCLFMVASSNQDPSNTSSLTDSETIPTWRLVPNDNNVAQRSVHVVPAASSQALLAALNAATLWVRNPGRTDASMRFEFQLPQVLADNGWLIGAASPAEGRFPLAPGAQEETRISVTPGADFDPREIKAASDRDILVMVLADDGLVGGVTYRLDPTL